MNPFCWFAALYLSFAGCRSAKASQNLDAQGYFERVKEIGKSRDAESVQKLVGQIEAEWRGKKDSDYFRVMLELCGVVSSWPAMDSKTRILVRQIASMALESPSIKPIDSEVRLRLYLQGDTDYLRRNLKDDAVAKERLIRVSKWLATWQRIRIE